MLDKFIYQGRQGDCECSARSGSVTKDCRADDKVYLRLSHAMVIGYNPAVVNSETLLAEIRKCDKEAVMAGF